MSVSSYDCFWKIIGYTIGLAIAIQHPLIAQEIDRQKTIELLEASINRISSFDLNIITTKEFYIDNNPIRKDDQIVGWNDKILIKPKVYEKKSRQYFQNGKRRIEEFDSGSKFPRVSVTDAERETIHNKHSATLSLGLPQFTMIEHGHDYVETFRTVYGKFEIITLLKERADVFASYEKPNGFLVIRVLPAKENELSSLPSWGFTIICDPNAGMLPIQIEILDKVEDKLEVSSRTKILERKKLRDGTHVPVLAVTEFPCTKQQSLNYGKLISKIELRVDQSQSIWNQPLKENTFDIPVPAGTRVLDTVRNVAYVTGKADPGKNLEDLAKNSRGLIPNIRPQLERQSETTWIPWIITSVLILLVTGTIFIFRRRSDAGKIL